MQTVCNTYWDAGKGTLTAQNTEGLRKPFGSRGSAPDPAEGAYSAPANPLVGGEGLAIPSPRTPPPLSTLRASPLLPHGRPQMLTRDVFVVANLLVSLCYSCTIMTHNAADCTLGIKTQSFKSQTQPRIKGQRPKPKDLTNNVQLN